MTLASLASTPPPAPTIAPHALAEALQQRSELALLDVREVGVFARKHLLHAVPAPLWRLELLLGRLVPRPDTRIVLADLDESLVHSAAARLRRLGYHDVSVLAGGTLAWEAAGLEVFSGDNVPSKAFGEFLEHQAGTPNIDVATLREMQARGDKLVVVDGRTPEEFFNFSLPGATSLPNGELALRIRELAPDPTTLVVVQCAGRTRSIVGAQTLIDAGLPNPVVALRDGTMAWLLAGHTLESGRRTPLPEPDAAGPHLAAARDGAQAASRRAGVRSIDSATLAALRSDTHRNLFCLDTRSAPEYRAGHLRGWRWAPGGQLLQATDQFIGVRHARVVLADWDGVRAHATGALLTQMGSHEVLLYAPQPGEARETGDEPGTLLPDPAVPPAPAVSPQQAQALHEHGAAVLFDVDKSLLYGKKHIAGAWFSSPDRLHEMARVHARGRVAIVSSSDGVLAARMAGVLRLHGIEARALLGGNAAWFGGGLPTATGRDGVLTGEDDAWYAGYAYSDETVRRAKFREYLEWEVNLAAQLQRAGAETAFRRVATSASDDLACRP